VLWTFVPIAALLTITPGAGTAMVVRSTMRGGRRAAVLTVVGNEIGVVVWACLSVLGISALVAASNVAFLVLKAGGAVILVWLGVNSLLGRSAVVARPARNAFATGSSRRWPTRSWPCSTSRCSRSSSTGGRAWCRRRC
jgi:threonine/homoserine/homoserine lactone efflux protein